MGVQETPLEVKSVRKVYYSNQGQHEVVAVKDVSFCIQPGEVFGLLGPNGAGKTTTISMITGLEKITSGHVRIFGFDTQEDPLEAKKRVGVVPQEIVSQGFFNLFEILQFHSGYYGIARNNERISYLLHKLGLWTHRHKLMKQLSGGMKRRMMIAKALVHSPRLLILDEPTAGVDIELRNSLWDFVRELQEDSVAILLTTHYLQEAEALCDRVGIIHQGRMVQQCGTKELMEKEGNLEAAFLNLVRSKE